MSDRSAPRLVMRGVVKSFGATRALAGVDFEANVGEVHALIGENGAGKSTLMKILAGVHPPDAGSMEIDGRPYAPADPLEARRRGVAMIFQELATAPHLSVGANVLLGVEPARRGVLRRDEARSRAGAALAALGRSDLDLDGRLSELSIAAQQIVEIARALVTDARVIVLDEPTSSLTGLDVEKLLEVIGRLKARGVSIIYISHFLEEVQRVADSFTVLRDGASVGGGLIAETTIPRIVEMMVGRAVAEMFPRTPHEIGETVLEADGLTTPSGVRGAALRLRRGEILGLFGLVGAGRTELLRALFGLDAAASGSIRLKGLRGWAPAHDRVIQGAGMLSEDRKSEGLALNLSVEHNLTLSKLAPFVRGFRLRPSEARRAAERWIERVGVKAAGADAPVESLSGGNQQKVQLARLLHHDCDVLLLDEPTRGIDVASKVVIYEWIGRLAAQGKAVLFVSSYTPELLGVCDTIAVMRRGELGAARAVADWDERSILAAATGASAES